MPLLTADFVEYEYNNRARVPEHPAIFSRWADSARAARQRLTGQLNVPYGQHARQVMDVFAAGDRTRWLVFIHGGYWRAFSKDEFSWIAEPYVARGVSVAIVSYRLCPEVSIADITADCQAATVTLSQLSAAQAAARVVLAGHSAGGHTVATLLANLAADGASLGFAPAQFAAGISLSGLFDLTPLTRFGFNQDLRLTEETARALSPIHAPPPFLPLQVYVGESETSEYHRQSALIAAAWPTMAAPVHAVPGANHFTILDAFAASDSPFFA